MTSQRALLYGHVGLTAILAVLCLSANSASFAQNAPAPARKIGIVDIGAAFSQYHKKKVLEAEINALKGRLEQDLRRGRQAIKALNDQVAKAAGEEQAQLQLELEVLMQRSRILRKHSDERLQKSLQSMTVKLLRDIDRAIKTYGKEKGFAVIFRVGDPTRDDSDFKSLIFQFQTQTASYHDPALDVTADIVARLNKAEAR